MKPISCLLSVFALDLEAEYTLLMLCLRLCVRKQTVGEAKKIKKQKFL